MYPHGHNLDQPPYPGNSFPMAPPPRKTRWGLITASLAAAFALSVGGAYAYDHLIVKGESTTASSSSSSGPPISVRPEPGIGTGNQSVSPTKPTLERGSPRGSRSMWIDSGTAVWSSTPPRWRFTTDTTPAAQ
jgi:hypothetical protein